MRENAQALAADDLVAAHCVDQPELSQSVFR